MQDVAKFKSARWDSIDDRIKYTSPYATAIHQTLKTCQNCCYNAYYIIDSWPSHTLSHTQVFCEVPYYSLAMDFALCEDVI